MKTVHELNANELEDLQESLFHQYVDSGDLDEVFGIIGCAIEIPMSFVISHYEDVSFVEEDFFCNL